MRYILIALLAIAPACSSVPKPPVVVEAVTQEFDPELFEAIVKVLQERVPLAFDVRVAVMAIDGPYYGHTNWNELEGHMDIQIEVRQQWESIVDTLIHEWAHAMVWDLNSKDRHDDFWGVAYSRAYRAVMAGLSPAPVQPATP